MDRSGSPVSPRVSRIRNADPAEIIMQEVVPCAHVLAQRKDVSNGDVCCGYCRNRKLCRELTSKIEIGGVT